MFVSHGVTVCQVQAPQEVIQDLQSEGPLAEPEWCLFSVSDPLKESSQTTRKLVVLKTRVTDINEGEFVCVCVCVCFNSEIN